MTTKNFVRPDATQEDDAPLIVIDDPTVNLHYNYELLPPDVRNDAMAAAVTIRRKDAQATGLAWEIGGILNNFKDSLRAVGRMDPHRIRLRTPHCAKADADQSRTAKPRQTGHAIDQRPGSAGCGDNRPYDH